MPLKKFKVFLAIIGLTTNPQKVSAKTCKHGVILLQNGKYNYSIVKLPIDFKLSEAINTTPENTTIVEVLKLTKSFTEEKLKKRVKLLNARIKKNGRKKY